MRRETVAPSLSPSVQAAAFGHSVQIKICCSTRISSAAQLSSCCSVLSCRPPSPKCAGPNLAYYASHQLEHVTGVDPNPEMEGYLLANAQKAGLPAHKLTLVRGLAERLPVEDESQDVVIMTLVRLGEERGHDAHVSALPCAWHNLSMLCRLSQPVCVTPCSLHI